jgi:BirA family biotin operon repressor/biotin-[acetyl-CoA-carboxylase] ligase
MIDEKLLEILRTGDGSYISGEELCKHSGISRAAVWKRIEKLREEGYEIEALPHLGYRLTGLPDRLIPAEIKLGMETEVIGGEVISYNRVDSTNDVAYELAEKGLREGSVVLSDEQTRGKGRHGRAWASPPMGGIYMSCILRPRMAPSEIARITLLAAVAVARAVRSCTGLEASIKWPNDIMIGSRKICGILTEMKAEQDSVDFIVLGIGVNVNTPVKHLPKTASSLKVEAERAGSEFRSSRIELARNIIETLDRYYDILKRDGFEPIIEEWKTLSSMLGSRIRVVLPNREFEAQAHTIDRDGALIVRLDSGIMERVSSGDIIMIRQKE